MEREKVTLSLPKEIMDAVRRETVPRGYSRFIAEAITYYLRERERKALRERLTQGYQATAQADRELSEEWLTLEVDAWNHIHDEPPYDGEVLP